MNDAPHAEDLLRAVERFLEGEVVPALDGVARFHARVAANVVAMVAREIETDATHVRGEWERLAALLGDEGPLPAERGEQRAALIARNEALVARIRAGDADAGGLPRRTPRSPARDRRREDGRLEAAAGSTLGGDVPSPGGLFALASRLGRVGKNSGWSFTR